MKSWPFGSKQPSEQKPKLQNVALEQLAEMFLRDPQDPTPGSEAIDVSRFDFSIESLGAMDEHLEVMRGRGLEGRDLLRFVLRAGAYVGEVIRRHTLPPRLWHWVDYEESMRLDPKLSQFEKSLNNIAVLWDGRDRFTFPLGKVFKYLANGAEDSVKFYAQVMVSDPPAELGTYFV